MAAADGRTRGDGSEMDIFSNFGLWGAGWTGWIIPFLFGLSVVVFFHELGHFLVARWCGVRVLTFSVGFGPELVGFNDRYGTRWKLSAIPLGGYVKFFGDDNAASVPDEAAVAAHDRGRAPAQLLPSAGRAPRRHCRGRADRQFHPGHRDLSPRFSRSTASRRRPRASMPCSPIRRRPRPASSPATWCSRSTAAPIESFSDMQRIVSANAGRTLHIPDRSWRHADHVDGHARAQAGQGRLRQQLLPRGSGRQPFDDPDDVKTEHVDPLTAVWLGAKETWFIIDRTFSYHRRPVRRPRMRRPARRPDPDRADFRSGRHAWASCRCCIWRPCCRFRSAF